MTVPKNKRKTITVDGTKWEYCVTSFLTAYLKNLSTNESYRWHMEVKPKWGYQFLPSDAENLIRSGKINDIEWKKI